MRLQIGRRRRWSWWPRSWRQRERRVSARVGRCHDVPPPSRWLARQLPTCAGDSRCPVAAYRRRIASGGETLNETLPRRSADREARLMMALIARRILGRETPRCDRRQRALRAILGPPPRRNDVPRRRNAVSRPRPAEGQRCLDPFPPMPTPTPTPSPSLMAGSLFHWPECMRD